MTDSKHSSSDGSLAPYAGYESPAALLADTSVDRNEKIDILRAWDRDLRQLMVAESEGLNESAKQDAQAPERLQQVADALNEIGAADEPDLAQSDVTGSSTA